MIVTLAVILGAAFGAWTAHRRKGSRLDMAQYAAGYGIALGVVTLFATLILQAVI